MKNCPHLVRRARVRGEYIAARVWLLNSGVDLVAVCDFQCLFGMCSCPN